jgi:chloramphenicol 3-O phosphotransferase
MFGASGQLVILNGAPRSGKSSIVAVIQESFAGPWLNLGVDVARSMTPPRYQPGLGLRPGEPTHPVAPLMPSFYAALYGSIAAHSRAGLNVAVDVGHYDVSILADCARRLDGLPVLFVGVRCPIDVVLERRAASGSGRYVAGSGGDPVPAEVRRWQNAVHVPGIYDLEVDTSLLSPEQCARKIHEWLDTGTPPTAFRRLQALDAGSSS